MVKLDYNELKQIIELYPKDVDFNCFIESGTYKCQTIFEMAKYFKKLYTIEINKTLYDIALKKNKFKNIKFYLGDSIDILPILLININTPCIFWLDGHWSLGSTGRGKKDVPVLDEVKIINDLYNNDCIIIIDDYQLFYGNSKVVDWSGITTEGILTNIQSSKIIKYYIANDRLIIFLQKI